MYCLCILYLLLNQRALALDPPPKKKNRRHKLAAERFDSQKKLKQKFNGKFSELFFFEKKFEIFFEILF
jgi:hypothetical protein